MAELRVIIEDSRSSLFMRAMRIIILVALIVGSYLYGFSTGSAEMLEAFIEVTPPTPQRGEKADVQSLRTILNR